MNLSIILDKDSVNSGNGKGITYMVLVFVVA
jgi:hypothetical protein